MNRASPTYRMALEIVAIQLAERDQCLICPLCNEPIQNGELAMTGGTVREHMKGFALDPIRNDKPWNMRIVCKCCAAAKTNGTRASGGLGGDISETARSKRLERNRIHGKPKSKNPIQSRGFQKPPDGYKRKIGGRRFNGEPIGGR